MVTLKDIAKKANVSVMTVSRVVNGNQSKVSKETAERIHEIIKELGYVPNYSARSLSSKKSNLIAIILRKDNLPDDPHNAKMLSGIIPYLQEHGYYSMVVGLDHFDDIDKHLKSWHAAGAIFLGLFEDEIIKIKNTHAIPLIFTDSYEHLKELSSVGIDDYKGGFLAGEHFCQMGHKKLAIGTYALEKSPISNARYQGFKDALKKHDITLETHHIFSDYSCEHLSDAIIESQVTGIFITADLLALDVMTLLMEKGYEIPNDFSIIGFDNLPYGNYSSPKLTTISQDIQKKAKVACDILLKHMDTKLPCEKVILDVQLEIRESVRCLNDLCNPEPFPHR